MKNEYKGYKSLDQWKSDMELFRKHPDDKLFMSTMVGRLESTKGLVKELIELELQGYMMEYMPKLLLKKILNKNDKLFAIIKEDDDIWFSE